MTRSTLPMDSVGATTIDFYRRNGFVKVPGVLTLEEVDRFAAAARVYVDRHREESYAKGYAESVFTQLVNVWQGDKPMRELTLHPRLATIASELAGMPVRLWHDHLLVKQPHNEAATEFHQDRPYWPHATSRQSLSAWVALVDVPVERGCMTFLPGSHEHTELRPQDLRDDEDLFRAEPELRWQERVTVPLRAGDCTFHHSYTAHMATPNYTDDPRFAHVIVYMDAETTYDGKGHVVTDPLGMAAGNSLDAPIFPELPQAKPPAS